MVSLQTSILERKLQKPNQGKSSPVEAGSTEATAEARPSSTDQRVETREVVSHQDPKEECAKEHDERDQKEDQSLEDGSQRKEEEEEKEEKEKEKSGEGKVQAPHASPGSSTISGKKIVNYR